MKIYWFNWPSKVGGADTKFVHLLALLKGHFDITVVPNSAEFLKTEWYAWLQQQGYPVVLREELPAKLQGWAISLCNSSFFKEGLAEDMKQRGLGVIWSNEMMWHFKGELDAVKSGLVDRLLYVSPVQRQALEPGYRKALELPGATEDTAGDTAAEHGSLGGLPWVMAGNYIDPEAFPLKPTRYPASEAPFVVGRLSRPDPDKYPDDFPTFYERLGLQEPVKFRVMAWSEKLADRWCHHAFDARWDLLETAAEPTAEFLRSLDLLVYDTSPRFQESWGRAVVEAMLSGVVPILPRGNGHHLERLISHGVSGFLCDTRREFGMYARQLQADAALLAHHSQEARNWAVNHLCQTERHLSLWRRVFGQ